MALAEKSETLNSDNQDLLVVYGFLHLNITFSQIPSLDSPGNSCRITSIALMSEKSWDRRFVVGVGGFSLAILIFFSRSVHYESQLAS